MRTALALIPFLLGACAELDPVAGTDPTVGETHTELSSPSTEPGACVHTGTVSITDGDAVAPGFDAAPSDLIDAVTGWYTGTLDGVRGDLDGSLEVDDALGQVRAVYLEGDGCSNYYEVGFVGALLLGDDVLDTSFAAVLQARSATDVRFNILIPEYEMRGTLMTDGYAAGTVLRVGGRFSGEAWTGSLEWQLEDQVDPLGAFTFYAD
ncbi:MAG: hypothetical protein ACI8PZ_001977 [Myxococcota bacterium]|jgi:hypothetical protein